MKPSWQTVCEYFGLDTAFQYTAAQKTEYVKNFEAAMAANARAGARIPRLENLLREARGHLEGNKMSVLAMSRNRLIAAIDAEVPRK